MCHVTLVLNLPLLTIKGYWVNILRGLYRNKNSLSCITRIPLCDPLVKSKPVQIVLGQKIALAKRYLSRIISLSKKMYFCQISVAIRLYSRVETFVFAVNRRYCSIFE